MQTPLKRLAGRIRSTDAARAGAWRLPLAPAHPDGRRATLPLRAPNPHQILHPETSPMQPTMTSLAGWSMTAQMHGPARPEAMLLVPRMVSGQPGFAGTRFPRIAAKRNSWHCLLSSSNPDASRTTLASPGSLVTGGASVPMTGGGGRSCARLRRPYSQFCVASSDKAALEPLHTGPKASSDAITDHYYYSFWESTRWSAVFGRSKPESRVRRPGFASLSPKETTSGYPIPTASRAMEAAHAH